MSDPSFAGLKINVSYVDHETQNYINCNPELQIQKR